MDDERQKRIEAGREKLVAYKKKKEKKPSGSSDSSFSLSPPLPDSGEQGHHSDSSVISEHLNSNSDSVENDRSYQEIEVSNVANFSLILQNLPSDEDVEHISQENKPPSLSLSSSGSLRDAKNNIRSILDEILHSDNFKSESEHTLRKNTSDSNTTSFNLFEGVDLNDSLLNEYVVKSESKVVPDLNFNTSHEKQESLKVKHLEELLVAKDTTIAVLASELESLRERTSSNHSLSLNTSTTDYKLYHDEFQNRIVEFQNALSHRDSVIQQLTEALQQSVISREQLQEQSEYFSKEIVALQKQLAETSLMINRQKWNEPKQDSLNLKESFVQTDSVAGAQNKIAQSKVSFETYCSKLEETLNPAQASLMSDLKSSIELFVQEKIVEHVGAHQNELKILQDKLENEKMDHDAETTRLRELLAGIKCDSVDLVTLRRELEAKHTKELEELRTYFEKKCADLEKHYSEEIFSQQSRKMSSSSCSSDSSDFGFSNRPHPGPGGDTVEDFKLNPKKRDLDISKDDLAKLRTDVADLHQALEKYNLEKLSAQDQKTLKEDLARHDLLALLKYNLSSFKTEMQNKYHAELEILREDYENRIDSLNVEHENRMQSLEKKYLEQIDSLKYDLDEALRNVDANVTTAQEVASSGEYELAEVVQSYERRLQEQVTLAKIDIINALELQIQMLVANTAEDAEWPVELLQLRNRFTEKYEKQIAEMEENHQEEVSKLREEHRKILNGALERARRRSLKDGDSLTQTDLEIIKERDNLKKTTSVLRQLLSEIMKYFSDCEEELNNTLVEELLKHGFDKNLTELEVELNLNESSNSTCTDSLTNKKRVHLTPRFEDLMATIDSSVPSSLDSNISLDVKNELGACLQRLRADANEILALSTVKKEETKEGSLQDRINSLTRQLLAESQARKDLEVELEDLRKCAQNLEIERSSLDTQVEQLVAKEKILSADLGKAKEKISELIESGHKEVISEGYGEHSKVNVSLGEQIATLAELQERVRNMVVESLKTPNHPLIHLIEELCREGDRVIEEAKNDHDDLRQQIEAADKKLRATCHFLEEQAAEREQERDEAQREISAFKEQLKEREKDRASNERISKEVEHLDTQMRSMSKLIEENEVKYTEIETEKKEAIEKIFVLRDIIRDLEAQVEAKAEAEVELKALIQQLQEIIKQQNKTNEELSQRVNLEKGISEAKQYQEHIDQLEDELHRLRLNTEFAGNEGALKQIKTQLNEFELNIDKRTRDLEALHAAISATTCSSPSEDMSLRDQIPRRSPSVLEECDVPLQQLARLKEKLMKHSRAEDAAVKRIRDLEMELVGLKHELDDVQNERDILQDQVSEQMVLISSLQMRLDDQRLRAEQVQKQTNTSLEVKIYDLETEIKNLIEMIAAKDKTIKQMTKTIDETKKKLQDQEQELTERHEEKIITDLHMELQKVRAENASLLNKINNDAQNAQVLPNLVDNILADKNKDIEKLREQLERTQSELSIFTSLNLDPEQLKALSRLQSSERALSDILSLIDLAEPEQMRKAERVNESLNSSLHFATKRNETTLGSKFTPEFSSIEHVEPPLYTSGPLPKSNSTEKSIEKKVHFDESIYSNTIEKLRTEVAELRNEIFSRDETIREYTERLQILGELEYSIGKLQEKLDFTESSLEKATQAFEKEQNTLKESEKNLRVEVAEKKMYLTEKEKELELIKQDSVRKDQMYIDLAKEKRELEKCINKLREELDKNSQEQEMNSMQTRLRDSEHKIRNLESELDSKRQELEVLQELQVKLEEEVSSKSSSLNEFKEKIEVCNNAIKEKEEVNSKLAKELKNKEAQFNSLNTEIQFLKQTIEDKNRELETLRSSEEKSVADMERKLKEMKNLLVDRETEIEILNEDTTRYQDDIAKLETKLRTIKTSLENEYELKIALNIKEIAAKELQVEKFSADLEYANREIMHLKMLVEKKEQIVSQMSEDSKSLHINLETIQSKIQETGNVLDLKRKLEETQVSNASLQEELSLLRSRGTNIDLMTTSIDEITGEVHKQLDYSATLDSNILSALNASEDISDLQLLKQALFRERQLNSELEKTNDALQAKLQDFEKNYMVLKRNCNVNETENANMVEQLRIRLEKALENENEFEKLLETEKRARLDLESQVIGLKQKAATLSSSENSKTELTEYKSLPNLDSQELLRLKKEVQLLQEENSKVKGDFKDLKRAHGEADATLKYTKDMLQLKNEEIGKLEAKMEALREVENSLKDKLSTCKTELEQRNREIENSRTLMAEFEQEGREMKNEINRLNETLKKAIERERKFAESSRDERLREPLPEKFAIKMKELSKLVKEHTEDNKNLTEALKRLTDERKGLLEKMKEMEENAHAPFDDPVARANHLFARYLRAESYRKALVWQKKYLVALLATYQTYPLFSHEFPIPENFAPVANQPFRSSGKPRFKALVVSIIAVIRMRYLVQRWHSGKRNVRLHYRQHSKPSRPTHFQVGQPVSSQNFPISNAIPDSRSTLSRTNSLDVPSDNRNRVVTPPARDESAPWSGATPPCKDRSLRTKKSRDEGHSRMATGYPPLQSPTLLSSYAERFDQIQQKLGMALDKRKT